MKTITIIILTIITVLGIQFTKTVTFHRKFVDPLPRDGCTWVDSYGWDSEVWSPTRHYWECITK